MTLRLEPPWCVGKKGAGKKRVRGTIGKKSAPFFPRLWLVGVVFLPPRTLAWTPSFLIKFGFPLFPREVDSDQAESSELQGVPGCSTSLHICCNGNFFTSQRIAGTPFIVKSPSIWFCSNQLEIPFQMIHLIETSGSLTCGSASVISSLKIHSGSWDHWVNKEEEMATCSVSFSWLLWWHRLLAFSGNPKELEIAEPGQGRVGRVMERLRWVYSYNPSW